jgi:hypothetical protein
MTTVLSSAVAALWVFAVLMETGLLGLLLWRSAYRRYPAFTVFVAFCVLRSTVLLWLWYRAAWLCVPVKWGAYVPQLVILLMLVMEVFEAVFHPCDTLPRGTLTHFLEAVGSVAVVAVAFAICFPGAQPTAWLTFARAMDQATSWVLCGIFGFIALFSSYFGIPWRHRAYGIGLGFLFYLSVDVAFTTIVAHYGQAAFSAIRWVDMAAFMLACVIWTVYFAMSETPRPVPTVEQLHRVRAALGGIRSAVESAD